MDLYFKCGLFDEGALLFNSLATGDRDVIAWNIMSMGCAYNENFEEACNYFWVLRRAGISPDEASYSTALHASAHLAALDQGTLIHNQIIKTRVRKEPGCSWIDVKFVFTVHDKSHARMDEIYEMLKKVEELVKIKGYVPQIQFAVNSAEEFKEQSLWYHSEKIALAFGLLALPAGAPIRIKKNLEDLW
ncbi:hypothetical protein CRYUN_Cryun29cG0019400 [Craigia yunnanensis]